MAGERPDGYFLSGWAVPEGLELLHDLVEQVRAEHPGLDPEHLMMLETAVIELANNVLEHGRPPGEVSWSFTLRVADDALEAVLADDGPEYEGDLSAVMPDPFAESGRGIALARAALDDLAFERRDGSNVWTMLRRT